LLAEEALPLEIGGPDQAARISAAVAFDSCQGRGAGQIAPAYWLRLGGEFSLGAARIDAPLVGGVALVGEDVAGVVENDVEDDGQSQFVSGIDKFAQLVIGGIGIFRETGIGAEEVDDAVTVVAVRVVGRVAGIAERRAEPDGAEPKVLDIGQLGLDAAEGAALVIVI
jgi:hypothetical protein